MRARSEVVTTSYILRPILAPDDPPTVAAMTSSGIAARAGTRSVDPRLYWAATGLFLLVFGGSIALTFGDLDGTYAEFAALGYPAFTVLPLGVAKVLGLVAILSRRSRLLTGLAFAGFFYDTALALLAHLAQRDLPNIALATTGMLATVAAYGVYQARYGTGLPR